MSWSDKYKRSINCDSPKGFSQRAHCAARKKRAKGESTKSKSPFNEMHEVKSHKSVEKIAKKHRLEVSFVKHQLEMGIPIEHEHTKDKDLATDIALQHLDEIPDYYTRLKKMESDAKKHHKKFKDVKEHCGCEEDGAVEELETGLKKLNDTSYDSIDRLMRRIMKKHDMAAKQLHNAFVSKHDKTPDSWIKNLKEGTLHHWFKGSKSKGGKPGWVQADGSPCANEPGETKTPKCFSSGRLRALKKKGKKGKSLIAAAIRRKREKDPGQQQKTGAAKPTNVPTFAKGKKNKNYVKAEPGIKEAMELNEAQKDRPSKGSGSKDACYYKVKSRYDVWPSAYASGALVKCRKVGADNWGTKKEENIIDEGQKCWKGYKKKGTQTLFGKIYNRCVKANEEREMIRYCPKCKKNETRQECKYGEKFWDLYSLPNFLAKDYDPNKPHPGNFPEGYDHEYSMARSELSTIISAAKRLRNKMKKGEGEIEAWVQSKITKAADYIDTAADYVDSGEMKEQVADTVAMSDNKKPFDVAVKKIMDRKGKMTPIQRIVALKQAGKLQGVDEGVSFSIPGGRPFNKTPLLPGENLDNVPIKLIPSGTGGAKLPIKTAKEKSKTQVAHYEPENDLVEYSNWRADFGLSEDWQKVNRKDKTDGLSQKAVNAYRREHPGSKLQTAVTEKKPKGKRAKRRASFCRRMKGMKSKLTSAKTARDPDSRINKALRRWNCN